MFDLIDWLIWIAVCAGLRYHVSLVHLGVVGCYTVARTVAVTVGYVVTFARAFGDCAVVDLLRYVTFVRCRCCCLLLNFIC